MNLEQDGEHNERREADRTGGLTKEQLQELGSLEANTWTITPPGGQPMSLSEHEEHFQRRKAEDEAGAAAMMETVAADNEARRKQREHEAAGDQA